MVREYKILEKRHGLRKFSALCLYCDQETEKYRDKDDAVISVERHISVIHKRESE